VICKGLSLLVNLSIGLVSNLGTFWSLPYPPLYQFLLHSLSHSLSRQSLTSLSLSLSLDVPILVPFVNPSHLTVIAHQREASQFLTVSLSVYLTVSL